MSKELCSTTILLMKLVKGHIIKDDKVDVYSWKVVANVLAPMYYSDMRLLDVFHIVHKAWLDARQESRLKMPYNDEMAMMNIMLAPSKIGFFAKETDMHSLEQVFQSMLNVMLSDLRFTTVDWMRDLLVSD